MIDRRRLVASGLATVGIGSSGMYGPMCACSKGVLPTLASFACPAYRTTRTQWSKAQTYPICTANIEIDPPSTPSTGKLTLSRFCPVAST